MCKTGWSLLDTLIPTGNLVPGAPSLGYHESSHILLTPYTGVRVQVRGSQLGPALVESGSLSRYYWVTQLTVQYSICSR